MPVENITYTVRVRFIRANRDEHIAAAYAFRVILRILFRNARFGESADESTGRAPMPAPVSAAAIGPAARMGPMTGMSERQPR